MIGHTGKDPLKIIAAILALAVFMTTAGLWLWLRQPRATNDELLDLINQLAKAQGYTIYEVPRQTIPHGWEIGRKQMSVAPQGWDIVDGSIKERQ